MAQVVLLGPQRADSPLEHDDARLDVEAEAPEGEPREMDAAGALARIGITSKGRVALLTAGWQERESEDAPLAARLGMKTVNLRLHSRSEEVFADDPELREAWKARQSLLRHMQDFYRLRLDYADDAARAIAVRHVEEELRLEEARVSIEALRQLDRDHEDRCRAIQGDFELRWRALERRVIAAQRRELATLLSSVDALVIAGGHVASLFNRIRLFELLGRGSAALWTGPIVAWSAGAMILGERVVLFHDFPPYGKDTAQVLEAGFGLAPGLVVLPDPRRRIRTDDSQGIRRFALRMAPLTCLAMDHGAWVHLDGGRVAGAAFAQHLTAAGTLDASWRGPRQPKPARPQRPVGGGTP